MRNTWQPHQPPAVLSVEANYRLNTLKPFHPDTAPDALWWSALLELDVSIETFKAKADRDYAGQFSIANDFLPNIGETASDSAAVTLPEPDQTTMVVILADTAFMEEANKRHNPFGVVSLVLGTTAEQPEIVHPAPPVQPDDSPVQCPKGSVVMGVIDGGIAFAHNLFRSAPTETRVESYQQLSLADQTRQPGYFQWHAVSRHETDALLHENTHSGVLDEAAFYREARLVDHSDELFATAMYRRSHGTHVMGVAAGYPMSEHRRDRPILACQLPSDVTADVTGASLEPALASAIQHIRRKADRFVIDPEETADGEPRHQNKPPVVINFSYGNYSGPHDGTGPIPHLIDRVAKAANATGSAQPVRFVLPAGNGNLARVHGVAKFTKKDLKKKTPVALDLRVKPDDRTASYVEIWLPYKKNMTGFDPVYVQVTTPAGETCLPVGPQHTDHQRLYGDDERTLAELSYSYQSWPTDRGRILLCINPTAGLDGEQPLAPSGLWHIRIVPQKIQTSEQVDLWIKRDETLPGFPRAGRQAYFDNPDYQRFTHDGAPLPVDPKDNSSPVVRAGTLSGFATGTEPVVVGGFVRSNFRLVDYSAAGPITPTRGNKVANRPGPDASGPSDDSPALPGVISAGSSSGSMVRMNGTSVAAPAIARCMADGFAKGKTPDRGWVWQKAEEFGERHAPFIPIYAPTRSGGGIIGVRPSFQRHRDGDSD